jgi:hypothetical protein
MRRQSFRAARWAAGLAVIALAATACTAGTGTGQQTSSRNQGDAIQAEAASLDQGIVAGQVTIAKGNTHDADIAIDPATGTIYAAWAVTTGKQPNKITGQAPQDIYVASSSNDGATWSKPARVNDVAGTGWAGFNAQVRIAAVGNGKLFVMYPTATKDFRYFTMTDRSSDGGKTWGTDTRITAADGKGVQGLYGALVNNGDDIYAAYLDYQERDTPQMPTGVNFTRSKNGGQTFSASHRAALRSCECCDNAVAVDSKGTLYVGYRSQDAAGKHTTIRDTAVIRSYNGGETWSYPTYMGQEKWVYNGCPEAGPELWVGKDDVLHGVYWTGKEGQAGVYYTKSTDGGSSFEKPLAVATADFYPPPYMDLAEGSDGSVWVVWDDRRTPERKVHLGRILDGKLSVMDPQLSAGVTPSINATRAATVLVWSDAAGLRFGRLAPA